ncbi:MAG: DUF484 family protein [Rhodospirillaceae bacterium]|jgi:uncharacterized protein YigA (DUF484 family)|nr:DUF484 family protein [Rhodospirillaceae bacterium]
MADRSEEAQKKEKVPALPSAAQVIAYLRRHPDFLFRHPELLDIQASPARHKESQVVDLQHFMVERLRQDVAKLRANQDEIIANSRDNLGTQERIHKAVLAMLEAETFEEFIDIITGDLVLLLEVDVVCLCIERTEGYNRRPRLEGLELLEQGAVDRIMGKGRQVLLRDEAVGDPEVFGGAAELVRSDALLRLKPSKAAPNALLAFGTRHPGYFHPGQGTELLSFLGRIIEFGIRSWLDLPKP